MARVVGLVDAHDAEAFGGKAAGLAACIAAGFPVPPGVAMRAGAEEPAALCEAVRAAGLAEHRLAVRSSAVSEDSAAASFAGMFLSVIDVSFDEVPAAAERVLASAELPQTVAYRNARGLVSGTRVGVIVQQLVASEVSGVLFTRDPVSGDDEIVVEAAFGLGENVLAGRVTPVRYRLALSGRSRSRPAATDASREPLGRSHLRALARLAREMDATFPGGSDVEWAFADGSLWVLQRRPITTVRA